MVNEKERGARVDAAITVQSQRKTRPVSCARALACDASVAKDRRRVVVVPTPKGDRVGELFAPLAVALRRSTEGYSETDLLMLTDFVKKMRTAVARTVDTIRDSDKR